MPKSRWILQTLILSVALNAALLCIFFYFLIRTHPLHFAYTPKEEVCCEPFPIATSILEQLNSLSFEQLIQLMNDERKVEQGYCIRDFALGALATYHDFDVERGLGRGQLSKRKWEYKERSFLLFPGLRKEDFEALQLFVRVEKCPFTLKGIFKCIRESGVEMSDPALLSFFCYTPYFVLLETLFARTHLPFQKKTILALALEGGWERLESFYLRQQKCADFSARTRQVILMDYIEGNSKTAAYLLVITDPIFAVNQLEDAQIIKVLDLLRFKTQEALRFVQTVAYSLRSDEVIERAHMRLAEYSLNHS